MNFWQFATGSPWLTFFLLIDILAAICFMWNRLFRHLNVRSAGWPPEHLDADGDFKPEKDEDE